MVHLHSEILLGHKMKEILPFATMRMDLESIMLSEISQSERDKCHIISRLVYVESNKQNKQTK